ncbi:gag-pol polyprotein [Cucumis melo var. makuwa]|uniref:Gag-pol polyprotein n=1 Tax=Cucumis melo var. makuwa TaxID=1194695 RepID=A0A5D3CXM5_CUCMM|nr:gag-pol polyprotein [Cucumis melo var. makuwa]
MNMIREGGSTTRSPVLDGTSYVYFMIAFLKFINNKIWKSVAIGWEHPFVTDVEGKVTPKPEIEWTTVENEASLALSNNESVANSDSKEDGRALLGCIMDDVALNAMVHEKLENDVKNDVLLPAPSANGAGVD